jgi:preprotein translocase subunit SecY
LTTVVGAVYLTAVQLIPEAFVAYGNALPYSMSGGAALIVVCTVLDLRKQVRDVSLTNPGGVRR